MSESTELLTLSRTYVCGYCRNIMTMTYDTNFPDFKNLYVWIVGTCVRVCDEAVDGDGDGDLWYIYGEWWGCGWMMATMLLTSMTTATKWIIDDSGVWIASKQFARQSREVTEKRIVVSQIIIQHNCENVCISVALPESCDNELGV